MTQNVVATDTYSDFVGVPDSCGNIFKISSTANGPAAALSVDELKISNTGEISVYTANSATVGTHTAIVTFDLLLDSSV